MDLTPYNLTEENENHFMFSIDVAAKLVRQGNGTGVEDVLVADFLSWGGDASQVDHMLATFRVYCPVEIWEPPSAARTLVDAAMAMLRNNYPSPAVRNRELRGLGTMTSPGAIQTRLERMSPALRHHVEYIQTLRQRGLRDACEWIVDETRVRSENQFTHIEVCLAIEYLGEGGAITVYNHGEFAKLLRKLRADCRAEAKERGLKYQKIPAPTHISATHIRTLRDRALELRDI